MSHLKILCVDDDDLILELITETIKMTEHEVRTAANGIEAVELISKSYFDLVITDLNMPGGVNGIGVLEAAKARSDNTYVILITGYASVNNVVEAMKKGAHDYIQKPLNIDELLMKIENIHRLKLFLRNADELREAMDVTEKNASQTIQNLEIMCTQLQQKLFDIKNILSNKEIELEKRAENVLEMLSMPIENNSEEQL